MSVGAYAQTPPPSLSFGTNQNQFSLNSCYGQTIILKLNYTYPDYNITSYKFQLADPGSNNWGDLLAGGEYQFLNPGDSISTGSLSVFSIRILEEGISTPSI